MGRSKPKTRADDLMSTYSKSELASQVLGLKNEMHDLARENEDLKEEVESLHAEVDSTKCTQAKLRLEFGDIVARLTKQKIDVDIGNDARRRLDLISQILVIDSPSTCTQEFIKNCPAKGKE